MKSSTRSDYERRVLRVQQVLAERLDEDIAPAELARAAALSLHHFHRVFRAQLGETVMQHVRRLRLERAARTLRATDERILDVALGAGYESHEAFTRAFEARFGVPPSAFRTESSARVEAFVASDANRAPSAEVHVRTYPALRVAFMRHRGSYTEVAPFWQTMMAWCAEQGLTGPLYGVCPDDADITDAAHLRFDACVEVDETFVAEDPRIAITTLPGGTYAVGIHVGSFARLAETYLDVIGRWFPASGYELSPEAPVIEHYLDDPRTTPEAALRTEVRVRIAE